MPELPDVEAYVAALRARVAGRVLERVVVRGFMLLRTADPPVSAAEGARVVDVRRIGKRIALVTDAGVHLVLHLMIRGRLRWREGERARPKSKADRAAFLFENGTLTFTEAGSKHPASLHVVRGAGRTSGSSAPSRALKSESRLGGGEAALADFDLGGVDPLTSDLPAFRDAVRRENHTLKRGRVGGEGEAPEGFLTPSAHGRGGSRMRTPHASSAALVAGIVVATLAPVAAAGEDPTTGRCDGLGVPLPMEIGLVCALAGLGTNASCPPSSTVPMSVSCTSTYSWSWLAYSRVHLPGDVTVTIRHDVETCVDLVDAPPACTNHPGSSTVTCAWDVDGECRGSGRVDESWGPVALGMGEQFKVLVHIDIAMHARSNAAGVPVGDVEYGDFSDAGAAVEVVDNGRG